MSAASEPDCRMAVKAACPGVSRNVTNPVPLSFSISGTWKALITCVIPPASVPATSPELLSFFLDLSFFLSFFLSFPFPFLVSESFAARRRKASIKVVLP